MTEVTERLGVLRLPLTSMRKQKALFLQEAVYVSVLLGAVRKTLPLPRLSLATFDEKPSL